jgi:hypothetical protein
MAFALHKGCFADYAALSANWAIRPEFPFQPFAGFGFVVENRIGKVAHVYAP